MRRLFTFGLACLVFAGTLAAYGQAPPTATPPPDKKQRELAHQALLQAREMLIPFIKNRNVRPMLNEIAIELCVVGDAASARETAELLPTDERDDALVGVAKAQADNGDIPGALQTTAAISSESQRGVARVPVAAAQAATRDFHGAFQTASQIGTSRIQYAEALQLIADQQSKAGETVEAAKTLRKASGAVSLGTDCKTALPICALYALDAIAEEQSKLGDAEGSAETLQRRSQLLLALPPELRYRLFPTTTTADTAAESGAQISSEDPQSEPSDSQGEDPTVKQASLIDAVQKGGDKSNLKKILEDLRTMKPASDRAEGAAQLAEALSKKKHFSAADEALRIGFAAAEAMEDDSAKERLLVAQAWVHVEAGDAGSAHTCLDGLLNGNTRSEALVAIAEKLAQRGDPKTGMAWAAAESAPQLQARILFSVARGVLQTGKEAQVQSIDFRYRRWIVN